MVLRFTFEIKCEVVFQFSILYSETWQRKTAKEQFHRTEITHSYVYSTYNSN